MAKWENWKPKPLLCGFFLGIIFMIVLAIIVGPNLGPIPEYPKDYSDAKVLKRGSFGDVEITRMGIAGHEGGESLMISINDYNFATIQKDKANTIKMINIYDGFERELARGTFDGGRLNKIYLFTNTKPKGMCYAQRPAASNLWQKAYYGEFTEGKENFLEDTDFDGQFDIKGIWNESLKAKEAYIFLDNNWQEVSSIDPNGLLARELFVDGKFQRLSYLNTELAAKMSTLPKSAIKKVYYDFEFGKGWKKRD